MGLEIMSIPFIANGAMAFIGFVLSVTIIPKLGDMFIRGNLFGIDQSKATRTKM